MDINFDVKKEIGKLGEKKKAPIFKLVSWSGKDAKYDIRKWGDDGTPFKGISFDIKNAEQILSVIEKALETPINEEPEVNYNMHGQEIPIYNIFGEFEVQGKFSKQITYMNWGSKAKYDIRGWDEEYEKCTKGISLDKDELEDLKCLLEGEINGTNNTESSYNLEEFEIDSDDWDF